MSGSNLLVTPHTPGTTSKRFREVAHAAARVLVPSELRIAFVVFVLDRTLEIPMAALKTPPIFRVDYRLIQLVTGSDGATGQTLVILANVQDIQVVVPPLLTAPNPSVTENLLQKTPNETEKSCPCKTSLHEFTTLPPQVSANRNPPTNTHATHQQTHTQPPHK